MTFIHISYHTEFNYTNQRGNVWHQQELIAKNQLELISICRFEVTVNNRSELETINVILNRLELIAINKKKGEMIILAASWDRIMKDLKNKRDEWEQLKEKLEGSLKKAPGGKIFMRRKKGKYPQYYFKDPASGAEEYIRKQETGRIQALFQKEYDQKCLSYVSENLNELDRFMKRMNPENFEDLYDSMPAGQKEWVQPVIVPDEIFARDWQMKMEEKKAGNPSSYPLTGEIVTENGEWVRSKSEKIIADKLRKKGIPYVYEVPLNLKGLGIVYPDFAILDLLKRRTIWFEHFGRMDDPQYCQKALNKIQTYAMNGYWFGDGLLYTFETAEMPLNTAFLDKIIGIGRFTLSDK